MPLFKSFGPLELILVLLLALIIFGPGRIARLGSEMGKGIRGFKEGLQPEGDKDESDDDVIVDEDKATE